jgi:hypothetical protein
MKNLLDLIMLFGAAGKAFSLTSLPGWYFQ